MDSSNSSSTKKDESICHCLHSLRFCSHSASNFVLSPQGWVEEVAHRHDDSDTGLPLHKLIVMSREVRKVKAVDWKTGNGYLCWSYGCNCSQCFKKQATRTSRLASRGEAEVYRTESSESTGVIWGLRLCWVRRTSYVVCFSCLFFFFFFITIFIRSYTSTLKTKTSGYNQTSEWMSIQEGIYFKRVNKGKWRVPIWWFLVYVCNLNSRTIRRRERS